MRQAIMDLRTLRRKHQRKRRVIAATVVLVVFAVTPPVYGRVIEGEHPRHEAAYIDALMEFTCISGCAHSMTKTMQQALRDDPQPYIAAGDKACDWLKDQTTYPLWLGPKPHKLAGTYHVLKFGPPSQDAPDPRDSPAQVWTEMFDGWQDQQAWTHLCGALLRRKTAWPRWTGGRTPATLTTRAPRCSALRPAVAVGVVE